MDDHGWDEPLWLETTPEDPRRSQAESAISAGVDLALACGGDGTVTAYAEGATGTGVPLAIIPMGPHDRGSRRVGVLHGGPARARLPPLPVQGHRLLKRSRR